MFKEHYTMMNASEKEQFPVKIRTDSSFCISEPNALSSDPKCGPIFALFSHGGKCEKTIETAHPRHQLERAKKRAKKLNLVLGRNLEDCHRAELECERFAQREALLNPVLGENLEEAHHHAELECLRSARQAA